MTPTTAAWDRLAELVEYPEHGTYSDLVESCLKASTGSAAADALERFRSVVAETGVASMQERYVEAFDLNPACTLNMGWHLLGDAPERGAWLVALREDLARAGVLERGELPDHLPALLRLIAREGEAPASELAIRIGPAIARVRDELAAQRNPFADLIDAVARTLDVHQHPEERP
jgi:nitrate reductase molybdenum cofactor assembly chaperone NarJ/NarW